MHFSSTGRGFGPAMWIACVLVVIAFVFIMNGGENQKASIDIPEHLRALSPAAPIETLMKSFEDQDYTVEKVRELESVSRTEFNRLIFEYNVTPSDGSETMNFTWEWVVPPQLITSQFSDDIEGSDGDIDLSDERLNLLLSQAELRPVSPKAIEYMDFVLAIIAEGQN